MENSTKLREYWEKEYENGRTQFDVLEPDEWIASLEEQGKVKGNVLDSGCGPGRTAIYLSKLGYAVLGTDISDNAIKRAKQRALAEQCLAKFEQADMTMFSGYESYFDTVIDIGCFHSLLAKNSRQQYAKVLHEVCREGSTIYLRAFSDKNLKNANHPQGVPALSEEEIRNAFSGNGWLVEELVEREIKLLVVNNEHKMGYCWFAEVRYV